MFMLEFVYQLQDGEVPEVVLQAARIASRAFLEVGIEDIYQRAFDPGEEESLQRATIDGGFIDIRQYLEAQHEARERLGVPLSQRTVSTIYAPSAVHEGLGVLEPYGMSIIDYGEAMLSTHNLRMLLLQNPDPSFNDYAAHFFAYTLAHEAGHLFGLVKEDSPRFTDGRHCANFCLMQSTSTDGTSMYLERTGGPLHFCAECAEDIVRIDQQVVDESS